MGTAYCSSESSDAQASADVARLGHPEHFQNQAIQKSIRRYSSSRSSSRCSNRIAVDAAIAAGVGGSAAFAKTNLFGELKGQRREIKPRWAFFEQSPDPSRHLGGRIEDGSMPAIVGGQRSGLKIRSEHEVEPVLHRGRDGICGNRQASREQSEGQLGNITGADRPRLVSQLVKQTAGGRRLGLDLSESVADPRSHVTQKRSGSPMVALADRDPDRSPARSIDRRDQAAHQASSNTLGKQIALAIEHAIGKRNPLEHGDSLRLSQTVIGQSG